MTPHRFEIAGVGVQFGGLHAVRDVSMYVTAGEVVGIIGANGAGKTTLLNAISGLVRSRGSMSLDGESIKDIAPKRIRRRGISRSFQHPALEPKLTMRDNMAAGLAYQRSYGWWSAGLGLPQMRRHEARITAEVEALADAFHIAPWLDQVAEDTPYGVQKVADVARALLGDPDVLLLDEPFAGLTAHEKRELSEAVAQRTVNNTMATLVIDHDVDLLVTVCDRVYVMSAGEVVASGAPETVIKDETVMGAYMGVSVAEAAT